MIVGGDTPQIDRAEVRRALGLLVDPNATHELRTFQPARRTNVVRGGNLDGAIELVGRMADMDGVYLTLNPVRADLTGYAKDSDVTFRRNLLIDCDRKHNKDQNATEEEKAEAARVRDSVISDLRSRGWPAPIIIDSGNGWHLIYRIDLPNDDLSRVTIEKFLKSLDARHGTDHAGVDTVVTNAGRITKLPGTWVRKGPHSDDRPHRIARILSIPTAIALVTYEQIRDATEEPPKPWQVAVPALPETDVERRAIAYLSKCEPAISGQKGHNAAFKTACKVGPGFDLSPDAAYRLLATHYNPRCEPPWSERELRHKVDEAYKVETRRGWLKDAERPGAPAPVVLAVVPKDDDDEMAPSTGKSGREYPYPLVIRGTAVKPEAVKWLMPARIPYGFLTLFAGRTSVGKSFVTLDIMARLSKGDEIPNGDGECFEPHGSLIISEDSHKHILAPRLIEANADMNKIHFMSWHAMGSFTLADTTMLDDAYHAAECPKLIVIDPPTNFLGGRDEHKNAEVRAVLMGVSIWCMSYDAACILITHCNKGIKKEMAALDRIIGSVAWASTSRIAHLLAPHPEERDQRVFVPLKSNIGEMPPGLVYSIRKTQSLAVVDWLGTIDLDADDALSGEKKKPRGVVAIEWLAERFREKREWLSDDLVSAGREAGVSRNALFSPEVAALPIVKRQNTYADGSRHWTWTAAPNWPPE